MVKFKNLLSYTRCPVGHRVHSIGVTIGGEHPVSTDAARVQIIARSRIGAEGPAAGTDVPARAANARQAPPSHIQHISFGKFLTQ